LYVRNNTRETRKEKSHRQTVYIKRKVRQTTKA
jgi:hypothetical protein